LQPSCSSVTAHPQRYCLKKVRTRTTTRWTPKPVRTLL
jgi:hypothetical protein